MPLRVDLGTFTPPTPLLRSYMPPVASSVQGLGRSPLRVDTEFSAAPDEAAAPPAADPLPESVPPAKEVSGKDGPSFAKLFTVTVLVVGAAWLMGR